MLIKVKNIRAGIVIIADAGLKLAPGEVAELEMLTPQARSAVAEGMLAQLETEVEPKPRAKPAAKVDEPKMSTTGVSAVDAKAAESAAVSQSTEQKSTLFEGAKNGSK